MKILCFARPLAVCLCLPLALAAADEKTSAPKTHVLFLGADLSVQHDKKLYRVEDVTGSALKIKIGRDDILVPTRMGPVALQVNAGLKLASAAVQLDDLKSGAAYTYANDPMRKLEEANSNAIAVADAQDMAQAQMARAEETLSAAQNSAANSREPATAARDLANARQGMESAQRQLNASAVTSLSDRPNLGAGALRAAKAEGNYDAMEVAFKVSSAVELDRPYMVVLFRFHDPAAKPGTNGLVIHAQAMDPIDSKPRYVRVLRGGLPPGFEFVDCTVHIYNRGEEVATNLSAKRVDLTRAETQMYMVMEHLGAHKGATLPAILVPGSLRRAQRQGLSSAQLTRTFFAQVAPDGALLGAFADEACVTPLNDPAAEAALREVFFVPALDQGKPVAGVARVRFADN
jgi:hypothetical protein